MRLPGDRRGLWAGFLIALALDYGGCSGAGRAQSQKYDTREEAVRFVNGGATLAGTLILPSGSPRYPAVVLFHGSGPQSRDLFMARWFAARGVAALTYDKRGVGKSTGDFRSVAFMELANDGLAAIQLLKSRQDIDPKQIGVWGLSQGGWLGPLAASRSADVAFVIAVSGPGVSPGEQMVFYYANELRARGMPEREVQEASTFRRDIWNYFASGQGYDQAKKETELARSKSWYKEVKSQADALFGPLPTPSGLSKSSARYILWFKQEMNYDPVLALRTLKVPVLFLFGDEDRITPVPESVSVIRRVMAEGGNRDFTIQVFSHADHGMYLVTGEGVGNIDPDYLTTMRTWLAAHVHKKP